MPQSSWHAEIWARDGSQPFVPETNAIVLEYKLDWSTREEGGYLKKTVYQLSPPKAFSVKYMDKYVGLCNKNRPNVLAMLYLGQL
jgi:hypothetical protein